MNEIESVVSFASGRCGLDCVYVCVYLLVTYLFIYLFQVLIIDFGTRGLYIRKASMKD